MAIQLPEPDYYTLGELAEKWRVSQDYLLRIANEGKIKLAIKLPIYIGIELQHADLPSPTTREDFERLFPGYSGKFRCKTITGKKQIEKHLERYLQQFPGDDGLSFFDSYEALEDHLFEHEWWPIFLIHASGYGFISPPFLLDPAIDKNTINSVYFSSVTHFISGESGLNYGTPFPFPAISESDWVFTSEIKQVAITEFLVPLEEVRRIEHQHEATKQAADDDVLGTKDKDKLQSMIAAMAQIIANKAPAYKNGDKVNATQIAKAIYATGLVDRAPETLAREISNALKQHGK